MSKTHGESKTVLYYIWHKKKDHCIYKQKYNYVIRIDRRPKIYIDYAKTIEEARTIRDNMILKIDGNIKNDLKYYLYK